MRFPIVRAIFFRSKKVAQMFAYSENYAILSNKYDRYPAARTVSPCRHSVDSDSLKQPAGDRSVQTLSNITKKSRKAKKIRTFFKVRTLRWLLKPYATPWRVSISANSSFDICEIFSVVTQRRVCFSLLPLRLIVQP